MADNKLNSFERKFAKMQFGLKVRIDLYKKNIIIHKKWCSSE